MPIKRDNILSLIGNGRYHSCILTTFSFDFYFFEMKMMKWLRSCGIRNVNVFIDGHFYSELMQQTTGDEMKASISYSLYPIFGDAIFHPKVWLLFGEKEGLLIVGSGNLTNSGNGTNDEIWGAYHFDIKQPENAKIFSAAWNYISEVTATLHGITRDKTTRWIAEHAQWLMDLPQIKPFQLLDFSNSDKVAFLYNTSSNSIWTQILNLIGTEKIIEITAVSPFYDIEGKALEEIKASYPNAQINVILDENGSIPTSLPADKRYSFYDWKEMQLCRDIGANQKSKLHAKLLHFKTQEGVQFCLFGSSNITPAGLGLNKKSNAEVSLFLKTIKGDILDRIGLKIKVRDRKSLSNFSANRNASIYQTIIKNNRFPLKLLAAELSYNILCIYSNGEINIPVSVGIFDANNRLITNHKVGKYKTEIEVKIDIDETSIRYIQLVSEKENTPISNKIIAGNYLSISKTHPNPKNEELEKLCNELQNGELRNVLDLIHYAIIDESEKEDGTTIIKSSVYSSDAQQKKAEEMKPLYDLTSYQPKEPNFQFLHEQSILISPSLRVLDALKNAHSSNASLLPDIKTDEQEENIGNISGNDESEIKIEKSISLKILESDKRKLKNFFKNLYGYFHHNVLYKDRKVSDYKLSLTDLTKYLIALELIHEFGGKSEKIEEEQRQLFFTYLPLTGDYENDNVKGCCLNIIGDFLRLAKNGFKEYTFEYTKKRFEELRYDALVSTIACVLNIKWNKDEQPYIKTLLLNSLHYLGWSSSEELEKNIPTLISQVIQKTKRLKQCSAPLKEHLDYFVVRICNAFKNSTKKRESHNFTKTASKGQIIYSSIAGVGYCYVVSVSAKNEYCLARPGFGWNEKEGEYLNHFPRYKQEKHTYCDETIYTPLYLPQVTIVDV